MFLSITLWNYSNYKSGTQNSENTMSRIQDSYYRYAAFVKGIEANGFDLTMGKGKLRGIKGKISLSKPVHITKFS